MKPCGHHPDNLLERCEIVLLHRMQRIPIKEWNHFHRKILSISDHENMCSVMPASHVIRLDDSTTETLSNRFEYITTGNILAHMELRYGLPPDSHVSTSLEGNVKAAFAIDKARNVMIVHDLDLSC